MIHISLKSISCRFEGRRENMDAGLAAVRRFRAEYGNPHSNTYTVMRAKAIENRPEHRNLYDRLWQKAVRYDSEVGSVRAATEQLFNTMEDYLSTLSQMVKKHYAANCGENSRLTQHYLLSQGHEAHVIEMEFADKDTGKIDKSMNHVFTLLGAKSDINALPNTEVREPKDWGTEAVIADSWLGLAYPAREAIKIILEKLRINAKQYTVKFRCIDFVPVSKDLMEANKEALDKGLF